MMKYNLKRLGLILGCLLGLTDGCGEKQNATAPTQEAQNPADEASTSAQFSNLVVTAGETAAARERLGQKIEPLVTQKEFEELDDLASELRTSKTQTAIGIWHLLVFYEALCELADNATEEAWKLRMQFLQNWVSARPKSITAPVALATGYKNFAWHARGSGYA